MTGTSVWVSSLADSDVPRAGCSRYAGLMRATRVMRRSLSLFASLQLAKSHVVHGLTSDEPNLLAMQRIREKKNPQNQSRWPR